MSVLKFSVQSDHEYNQVSNIQRCIRQRQSVTVHYYLLCQRTPIATCNRHIPYYTYHTCQLGSYVIEIDQLETLSVL